MSTTVFNNLIFTQGVAQLPLSAGDQASSSSAFEAQSESSQSSYQSQNKLDSYVTVRTECPSAPLEINTTANAYLFSDPSGGTSDHGSPSSVGGMGGGSGSGGDGVKDKKKIFDEMLRSAKVKDILEKGRALGFEPQTTLALIGAAVKRYGEEADKFANGLVELYELTTKLKIPNDEVIKILESSIEKAGPELIYCLQDVAYSSHEIGFNPQHSAEVLRLCIDNSNGANTCVQVARAIASALKIELGRENTMNLLRQVAQTVGKRFAVSCDVVSLLLEKTKERDTIPVEKISSFLWQIRQLEELTGADHFSNRIPNALRSELSTSFIKKIIRHYLRNHTEYGREIDLFATAIIMFKNGLTEHDIIKLFSPLPVEAGNISKMARFALRLNRYLLHRDKLPNVDRELISEAHELSQFQKASAFAAIPLPEKALITCSIDDIDTKAVAIWEAFGLEVVYNKQIIQLNLGKAESPDELVFLIDSMIECGIFKSGITANVDLKFKLPLEDNIKYIIVALKHMQVFGTDLSNTFYDEEHLLREDREHLTKLFGPDLANGSTSIPFLKIYSSGDTYEMLQDAIDLPHDERTPTQRYLVTTYEDMLIGNAIYGRTEKSRAEFLRSLETNKTFEAEHQKLRAMKQACEQLELFHGKNLAEFSAGHRNSIRSTILLLWAMRSPEGSRQRNIFERFKKEIKQAFIDDNMGEDIDHPLFSDSGVHLESALKSHSLLTDKIVTATYNHARAINKEYKRSYAEAN